MLSALRDSQKPELHFDRDARRHRLAPWTESGLETPRLHRFYRFLLQAQSRSADDFDIVRVPIGSNHDLQDDYPLKLCPPRIFGIFCVRAVCAGRESDAAAARLEGFASDSAISARSQPWTESAPESRALAVAHAAAAARAVRIVHQAGKWISIARQIGRRELHGGIAKEARISDQG